VTWPAILVLAAASYGLKALGTVLVGDREIRPPVRDLLDLAPVPLLAALILTQTLSTDGAYAVDARLPALGVAALLVWRRAPFLVVVLAAAAMAALLRAV
jgi:branched-subunit amino acid transport protein